MAEKKIILFGGTFAPVHCGHIIVAEHALNVIQAKVLYFVPAKLSPLKIFSPQSSDNDRLAMLKLATSKNVNFKVSDYELTRRGPSYTIRTVRKFKSVFGPDASIYWLVGSDVVKDLPLWHKVTELIDMCNLCVMHRACFPIPDFSKFVDVWGSERIEKLKSNIIQTPLVDISSSAIRKLLSQGLPITGKVHPAVEKYIYANSLYQQPTE